MACRPCRVIASDDGHLTTVQEGSDESEEEPEHLRECVPQKGDQLAVEGKSRDKHGQREKHQLLMECVVEGGAQQAGEGGICDEGKELAKHTCEDQQESRREWLLEAPHVLVAVGEEHADDDKEVSEHGRQARQESWRVLAPVDEDHETVQGGGGDERDENIEHAEQDQHGTPLDRSLEVGGEKRVEAREDDESKKAKENEDPKKKKEKKDEQEEEDPFWTTGITEKGDDEDASDSKCKQQ